MVKITSNTIVKNGMPFIGKALSIVLPYIDQMIVTISKKADKETIDEINKIQSDKIEIYWEDIKEKGELTNIQNEQLKQSKGDWILTLEDDELWIPTELEACISFLSLLSQEIDGLAINPFQLVNYEEYDANMTGKYYTKFFKREGTFFKYPFPKNEIWNANGSLHWQKNPKVKKVLNKYFHLPLLKEHSFRDEPEWHRFQYRLPQSVLLPEEYRLELEKLL